MNQTVCSNGQLIYLIKIYTMKLNKNNLYFIIFKYLIFNI